MRVLTILLVLIFWLGHLYGQQAEAPKDDSARQMVIDVNQKKISDYEWERLKDSVKRAELEDSIKDLKSSEKLKRQQLQLQLKEMQNRDSMRWLTKKKEIDSLRKNINGYPVLGLFGDTLFEVFSSRGGVTASDRATIISARIDKLAHEVVFKADSFKLVPNESLVELVYAGNTILTVSETDAIWNSTTTRELAAKFKEVISRDISHYRTETSFRRLAKEIGIAILIICLLAFIIFLLNKLAIWIKSKISLQENKVLKGLHFRSNTIIDSNKEVQLLQRLVSAIKWVFIILITYFSLLILFNQFPWTRDLAGTLTGYIIKPLKSILSGIWNYLPNMFTIAIITAVFYYILKAIKFFKTEISSGRISFKGFYPEWANPSFQIIRILLFAFMFILIFPYLPGSDSPVFKGVSVFLGFLFTFGSSGSLSNIIAGIVLTYMRQFTLGDRVKIGDITGDVVEKSLLVTRIKTIKNEVVSIPNTTVMSSHTVNYSTEAKDNGLILNTTVTIGYDVPWRDMHKTLIKAATQTEYILPEPVPFVLQTSLDDFFVSYQLNAYTREANKQPIIYSLLHQNIQDCCNEAGIEIMSPHYRAERDGNHTTIPAQYLGKNYEAPGFRVNTDRDTDNNEAKISVNKNDT